jgi:hypothetical protein
MSAQDSHQVDEKLVLAVVEKCLGSLEIGGAQGREVFLSTMAPFITACHSRAGLFPSGLTAEQLSQPPYTQPKIQHEVSAEGFASRMKWDTWKPGDMREGVDGKATVMIDHDLAMVWCPFWFLNCGKITHVGTNCFTLLRGSWNEPTGGEPGEAKVEWKIVGMTDTGRLPTKQDLSRLAYLTK